MIDNSYIKRVFDFLNTSELRYVLLKNNSDELPNNLPDGKDIDIVVHPDDLVVFSEKIRSEFTSCKHPWGIEEGYDFLYGLPEHQFWQLRNTSGQKVFLDVSFSLSCKSLMPKKWIPLDKSIQDRLWRERKWDNNNSWYITDHETRMVYLVIRCIFDKGIFNNVYCDEIEMISKQVNYEVVNQLFETVFFRYTPRLMNLINEKKYGIIIDDYLQFKEY